MTPKSNDPRLERSLRWLIAIRLVVITSVILPYLLVQLSTPGAVPTFDLLYLLGGLTYVASLVYLALLFVLAGRPAVQAYVQFAGDLFLVTGLVAFFGGIGSPFSLFYLVVIMVASVLLRRRAGLVVATAAYLLYASLVIGLANGLLPALGPGLSDTELEWRLLYNLAIHLFGFYAVALLTSVLAESVRRAEAELAAQRGNLANLEVFHRDVVQSISTGLATTDLDGRVTSVNRAAVEILGRLESELLGRPVEELVLLPRADWERLLAAVAPARPTERTQTGVRRGETIVPVGYSLSRLTDARGVPVGTILVFQDLSQWHRLQEELRLKDRMAAAGELADERTGVFATNRRLGAEHRHALAGGARAGGLDRRHGPDEGNGEPRAQMRQHQGRGGIAGEHDEIGAVFGDEVGHESYEALDQFGVAAAGIGKERIVGDIEIARIRPRLRDLAKDREATEPGIEDENGR